MESQIWEIVNNIVPIFRPSPWSQLKNELTLCLVSQFWINCWPGLDLMNFPIAISYPKRRFRYQIGLTFGKKSKWPLTPRPPHFWRIMLAIFIGPEYVHWQCLSLTDSLTDSCLVNLINVSLACEDGNSKLVEVYSLTWLTCQLKTCWGWHFC